MTIEETLRTIIREELRPILERLGMVKEATETLSVASAARRAECDPKTILARIRGGDLRGFRPPGARAYRIDKADFKAWLGGSRLSDTPDPDVFADEVIRRVCSPRGTRPERRRKSHGGK